MNQLWTDSDIYREKERDRVCVSEWGREIIFVQRTYNWILSVWNYRWRKLIEELMFFVPLTHFHHFVGELIRFMFYLFIFCFLHSKNFEKQVKRKITKTLFPTLFRSLYIKFLRSRIWPLFSKPGCASIETMLSCLWL